MGQSSDIVELTQRLIAAPSPNLPGDEREVASLVIDICAELGLPEPRTLAARPERPNLVVDLDFGPGGRHLALSGHLDTKPVGDAVWATNPFEAVIEDDYLYGLGACDMKGAVAAMLIAAAQSMDKPPSAGRLSVVLTADEEHGSAFGSRFLAETNAIDADAVVIGEPGGIATDWDQLQTVSRGIANIYVDVVGDQGHSSLSAAKGFVSATQEMAHLIVRFADRFEPTYPASALGLRPTVNTAVTVEGGVGFGVVPGAATFATDVRLLPGMEREAFERDLGEFLDEAMTERPTLRASYRFEESPRDWLPATEVNADAPIVDAARRALGSVLGEAPPLGAFPGTTDACWLQGMLGIPTLPGFGPGLLERAHAANERVSVTALEQAVPIYTNLITTYCGTI